MSSNSGTISPSIVSSKWRLVAAAWMVFWAAGCGDTFRPVATPITQPAGDPATQRNAIVLSSNDPNTGTSTHVDVSGDLAVAVHNVGRHPVHGIVNSFETFVANRDDNTVSVYATFAGAGASVTTITLPGTEPPTTCPVFLN